MQRSTRPKSAKGKVRPTPPSRPRPQPAVPPSSGKTSSQTSAGTSNSYRTNSRRVNRTKSEDHNMTNNRVSNSNVSNPVPEEFPSVSRPPSSLTKYRVLPNIPNTPDGSRISPTESEVELDLLSTFAQQMILDSTRLQNSYKTGSQISPNTNQKKTVPTKSSEVNTEAIRRPMGTVNNESPVHKKFKSSTNTRSVFTNNNTRRHTDFRVGSRKSVPSEPKEGEPKIKLALKLPDGRRVEKYFSPRHTVKDVMNYAQTKMKLSIRQCNICSMLQVPKVILKDWNLSLIQLDIMDKTVLYIEEKD